MLSAEHGSLIWRCATWCTGMGSVSAERKAGVHRQEEWCYAPKIDQNVEYLQWLGSWETGDLPRRLCFESETNLG